VLAVLALAVAAAANLAGSDSRPIPDGWKVTKDPSGSFQVATPADWQLGKDFFLKLEAKVISTAEHGPKQPPVGGLALWGFDANDPKTIDQVPKGHWYQFRKVLVHGDAVCSFWCVKESADFTLEEKSTMIRAGNTLKWIRK
jgi:hypothetical protein